MAFNLNLENIVKSKEGPWYVVIYLYRHITGGMQQTCKLKSVQVPRFHNFEHFSAQLSIDKSKQQSLSWTLSNYL